MKNIVLEKCFWDVFTTKKNISNGPFTLRGALNCTLTMNFVKLFVLIHSLIPIPLTLKTLKWMFMRQQPPKGSASGFLQSESNQTSQWACGANCCRSVWAEEVIKPHLCMIATSLFGTQQPQSLHLFCSRSLHPLKVSRIFCNPVGDEGPLRIPARLRASESCVLRWLVSTCRGCSQVARVASREGPGWEVIQTADGIAGHCGTVQRLDTSGIQNHVLSASICI